MSIIHQAKKDLEQYQIECEAALQKLTDKIRIHVKAFCDRWGVEFHNGNGSWYFGIPSKELIDPVSGGSLTDLLEYIDPELQEILEWEMLDRNTLGEAIEWCKPQVEHKFVVLEAVESLDGSIEKIGIANRSQQIDEENLYYNPISLPLANAIIEAYKKDRGLGEEIISMLPRIRDKFLDKI